MDKETENLCGKCKHGLVVAALDDSGIETYQFCAALETPIKFVTGKRVVKCTRFAKSSKREQA